MRKPTLASHVTLWTSLLDFLPFPSCIWYHVFPLFLFLVFVLFVFIDVSVWFLIQVNVSCAGPQCAEWQSYYIHLFFIVFRSIVLSSSILTFVVLGIKPLATPTNGVHCALSCTPSLTPFCCQSFLFIFYFHVYEWFACLYIYVSCMCLVLREVRRGCQILWNWNYRWLWTTWLLGTEA